MENVLTNTLEKRDNRVEEWTPTIADRCDYECPSQAYAKLTGVSGELTFCVHHFDKTVSAAEDKIKAFAFDIQDRRDLLIENRLQGDD